MVSAEDSPWPRTDKRSQFCQPVTPLIPSAFPGTGNCVPETEPQNPSRRVTETDPPQIKMRKSPPPAGTFRHYPKTREITDWVVADAVECEPGSLLFALN